MKNLLVVGNGFDLAHGLPTKYGDFLDYMTLYITKHEKNWEHWGINPWGEKINYWKYYNYVLRDVSANLKKNSNVNELFDKTAEQFKDMLQKYTLEKFYENTFVRYCLYVYSYKQTFDIEFNWIDIEKELLNFLTEIHSKNPDANSLSSLYLQLSRREFDKLTTIQFYIPTVISILRSNNIPPEFFRKAVFDHLFKELEEFNLLLKVYLKLVKNSFNDIQKVFKIKHNDDQYGFAVEPYEGIKIDNILSFNYTDTAKIYDPEAEIYFINGTLQSERIILGVENPNLEETNKYCNEDAHLFFKNVQRVLYDFSYDYKYLLNQNVEKNVYIMGHSLAISDKYILKDLMTNYGKITTNRSSVSRVIIYYYNDKDKRDKIANLYQLLGDELFSQLTNNPVGKPYISLINQDELTIK